MRNIINTLVLLLLVVGLNAKTCKISGEVIDRPNSKTLLLVKAFEDLRKKGIVKIPIRNNKFEYKLEYEDLMAYQLVFEDEHRRGSWRKVIFFPANGELKMTLHNSKNSHLNKFEGSLETEKYNEQFNQIIKESRSIMVNVRKLSKEGNYHSEKYHELEKNARAEKDRDKALELFKQLRKFRETKDGLTQEGWNAKLESEKLYKKMNEDMFIYMEKNKDIVAYHMLTDFIKRLRSRPEFYDKDRIDGLYNQFKLKYPNHPYSIMCQDMLWRHNNITEGGNFYDLTLKNLDKKEFTLSKQIKGKCAVIDIWAPWCGPCIKKSVGLIELYNKYKDKDFTVVAIASKYRDLNKVKNLIDKKNFPWVTLINNDKSQRIDEHYGVQNAGGGVFLVDENGKIVKVNPSVKEIEEFLKLKTKI
jgi:peroxiredoxin